MQKQMFSRSESRPIGSLVSKHEVMARLSAIVSKLPDDLTIAEMFLETVTRAAHSIKLAPDLEELHTAACDSLTELGASTKLSDPNRWVGVTLADAGFSTRIIFCCENLTPPVTTVEELRNVPFYQLAGQRNLGRKSLDEIINFLIKLDEAKEVA